MAHTCPKCDSRGWVRDVRKVTPKISRRRYRCRECGFLWSTVELLTEPKRALEFLMELLSSEDDPPTQGRK